MKDYKWCALSPNDPIQVPMRYHSKEDAEHHAAVMNELIPLWEENIGKIWNKDYWKVKPLPWIVKELMDER